MCFGSSFPEQHPGAFRKDDIPMRDALAMTEPVSEYLVRFDPLGIICLSFELGPPCGKDRQVVYL